MWFVSVLAEPAAPFALPMIPLVSLKTLKMCCRSADFRAWGAIGAAVIGPEGAYARIPSPAHSPAAANPMMAVVLKKRFAFIFSPKFRHLSPFIPSARAKSSLP